VNRGKNTPSAQSIASASGVKRYLNEISLEARGESTSTTVGDLKLADLMSVMFNLLDEKRRKDIESIKVNVSEMIANVERLSVEN